VRRGRVVAALMLLLAFTVGALSGMAAEEAFGIDWFDFLEEQRGTDNDRLLTGLGLTPEQRARAEEVLERQEDRLEEYWEARLPEIRQLLDESYAEIRTTLTAEQQAIFDRRVRKLDGRVPAELRED
jgi:Spy/CpxP family protein refolding chaperone